MSRTQSQNNFIGKGDLRLNRALFFGRRPRDFGADGIEQFGLLIGIPHRDAKLAAFMA
jgi:hypothetical protein